MTKIEAENIIKNYNDFDEETGEKYGCVIMSYNGTDEHDNHYFNCRVTGTETDEIIEVMVTNDGEIFILPT